MSVALADSHDASDRARCYLRLCGVDAASVETRLHAGAAPFAWSDVDVTADAVLKQNPWGGAPPAALPPLARGSIAYSPAAAAPPPCAAAAASWQRSARMRRLVVTMLILAQTALATRGLVATLPYHADTGLEQAIVVVFALLFAWISAGFWVAMTGFALRWRGGDPLAPSVRLASACRPLTDDVRTAIVYPVYHESIEHTLAGLRATWLDLARTGQGAGFDFFLLSDSRDPEVWLTEREACHRLAVELGALGRLHYRRRVTNRKRKPGNIGDFLRRWGHHYRYFVVMDADSVMAGETLVRMASLMEADPAIGILQSAPTLIGASSPHARMLQFSAQLYGPLFSSGLAALQLGDAVFWGHNAIIRVAPFMRHCGLRRLRGWGFLSGSVLSHDFIEAAYLRRAGYEVWLDPTLDGSYEAPPPTLDDELARDRRWAHGNLQHLSFLFRRGFSLYHRLAFMNGIMAYLASLLWLVYLALITVELARFTLLPIDYFPEPFALFPTWPELRPERAVALVASVLTLLFLPKLLALLACLRKPASRRAFGGARPLIASVMLESLLSALLAPIRMLAHSRHVLNTLLNLKVRWAGQNRTDETGWRRALLMHAPGSLLALAWSAFAWWLQPMFFYWSLPIAVPLLIAAPLSVWLGRIDTGAALRARGLFCTADEIAPSPLIAELHAVPQRSPEAPSAFAQAVLDPRRNHFHRMHARTRSAVIARIAISARRLRRAVDIGPEVLSAAEKSALLDDREALASLHRAAWNARPGSPWAQCIGQLCEAAFGPAEHRPAVRPHLARVAS